MEKQPLKHLYHCVYRLSYHLVLVTKYRRKVITAAMLQDLDGWIRDIVQRWGGQVIELSGETDHVHVLFEAPPTVQPSKAANSLKTATSRRLRAKYPVRCRRFYRKPVFWSRSYCILSVGGAPLEVLKDYIKNQDKPSA